MIHKAFHSKSKMNKIRVSIGISTKKILKERQVTRLSFGLAFFWTTRHTHLPKVIVVLCAAMYMSYAHHILKEAKFKL